MVTAARKLAGATGELVVGVGTSQDDLVLACQATAQSVKLLLANSKGGATTSPDRLVKEKLLEAAQAAAESSVLLLESCKAGSKSKTLQAQAQVMYFIQKKRSKLNPSKVSSKARDCADKLQEVVLVSNQLPGGEGLSLQEDTGEDLDELAEKELAACALLIENAAKTLMNRPKKEPQQLELLDDDTQLNEAIADAATAIAQTTASLVRSAHLAQKVYIPSLISLLRFES